MGGRFAELVDAWTSTQWLPYVLVALTLPLGLFTVFGSPFAWPVANLLIGGSLLAVTLGSMAFLVARHSGPGERGPDF